MQRLFRISWQSGSLIFLLVLLFSAMLAFTNMPAAVQAQGAGPTATPNDPMWRAFAAVRDAIEEQRNVDLTIVKNYEWVQSEWDYIDSCDKDVLVTDAREIYFGWTFRITSLKGETYEARISFDLKAVAVCDAVTTAAPTAAPDANGTPVAGNLPAPVAGSAAISGFAIGGHVAGQDQTAVDAMKSAGMTWVKKQLPISAGSGKGAEFINAAHGAGFKILLGTVGDKNALAANFDSYVTTFSQFLAELAKLGADAIEVWNEPNIDREWPAGQINGANYTKLLAAAYNAIKSANPNTIVISGAPAPTGFFGAAGCGTGGCNDDVFMQQMAAAGAAQYMDCVGLHYNEGIVAPSATSGDPRNYYPTQYFGSMLQRGYAPFGGKPVCFTELGYLSPEGYGALPPAFGWAANVTVAQQAAWLAEAATLAAQSGKVRIMIVWNVNFFGFDTDPQGGYAIIRPGGGCPACATLGAVMRK